jgi:hypothetical protein
LIRIPPPFEGGGQGGGCILAPPSMNKLFFGDNLDILREHISDAQPIAAKRRSTHSPGCSEAEPWVGDHQSPQSPERAM